MRVFYDTTARTHIKFCGITRAEDAQAAIDLGVDALGFVLVAQSPRAITPQRAYEIRRTLPSTIRAVALLRDPSEAQVRVALAELKPDLFQFHGHEDEAFCAQFGVPYLKAVSMAQPQGLAAHAKRYASAAALLLDSHGADGMGGTGHVFDWSLVQTVNKPLILAGGLTPQNVAAGIARVRPYAVDVSSGIESAPGVKNFEKMRDFVQAVRLADAQGKP